MRKRRKKEERRTENRFIAVGEFISSKKYTLSLPQARRKGVRLVVYQGTGPRLLEQKRTGKDYTLAYERIALRDIDERRRGSLARGKVKTRRFKWHWGLGGGRHGLPSPNRVEQNRETRRLLHLIERKNSHRCQQSWPEGKEFPASLEIRCSWGWLRGVILIR